MNNIEQEGLIPALRQKQILEIIEKKKTVSVKELSSALFINEATIRRDLNVLAKSGAVTRTYGGAVLNEGADGEIPFSVRATTFTEEKRQIGKTAAEFIRNGDTFFLDSSSTAAHIVPYLAEKTGLKIVTNGVKILALLAARGDFDVFSTGGKLRENSLSLAGSAAEAGLKRFHFDSAFFSCRGTDVTHGFTDSSPEEAEIRKILLTNSKKRYALCDSTKFGAVAFYSIAPVTAVTAIIADSAPEQTVNALKSMGVPVYF